MKNEHLWAFCFCVIFTFGIFTVLSKEVVDLQTRLNDTQSQLTAVNQKLLEMEKDSFEQSSEILEKISLIESTITPTEKRWAKIKKIRGIVQETIKSNHYPSNMDITDITTFSTAVMEYSEQYRVPPSLVLAVAETETAFNPKATSPVGAQGIMQLMSFTAEQSAKEINKQHYNTYYINDNVQLGVWYLSKLTKMFEGDVGLAVRAYNVGPSFVMRNDPKTERVEFYPDETVKYHEKVMNLKQKYEKYGIDR